MKSISNSTTDQDRRSFLKTTAAVGTLAGLSQFTGGVFAGEDNMLKIGIVGCGGRGSGAVENALRADRNTKLYAVADVFKDHIDEKLPLYQRHFGNRIDVGDRIFVGFDAYKKVIELCDFVLLATPPHFRPIHLKECVEKGKHVFFEKPVATDAPGIRSVLESAKIAQRKGITFASGFCYRHDLPKIETIKRIHDGAIGDVLAIHANYNGGPIWHKGRKPEWTEMEVQVRNWYYYTWLGGDHIVEQHVHNHDKAAWTLKNEYPIAASGMGGRQMRTEPKYGNIFDHHSVVYEYASGARLFSYCRQMKGCQVDVSDHVIGTKGVAELMTHQIKGATNWSYSGKEPDMYDQEHVDIFTALRAGTPFNDGELATKSSLMAILGRMATYSGQRVTWDQALNSKLELGPKEYDWAATPPEVVVAQPGNRSYKAF